MLMLIDPGSDPGDGSDDGLAGRDHDNNRDLLHRTPWHDPGLPHPFSRYHLSDRVRDPAVDHYDGTSGVYLRVTDSLIDLPRDVPPRTDDNLFQVVDGGPNERRDPVADPLDVVNIRGDMVLRRALCSWYLGWVGVEEPSSKKLFVVHRHAEPIPTEDHDARDSRRHGRLDVDDDAGHRNRNGLDAVHRLD